MYSWDTNVFLAHLKAEAGKPLADISAVADEIERGIADCIISVVVVAEMLDVIDDPQLATDFQVFMKRPNVKLVNVYPKLARKTAELRANWRSMGANNPSAPPNTCKTCGTSLGENRNIKTPDAIVLVTAMLHGVTVLHSLEPRMKRHSKTDFVDGLEICDPKLASGQMLLPEHTDDQPLVETPNEQADKTTTPVGQTEPVAPEAGTGPVRSDEHPPAEADGQEKAETAALTGRPFVKGKGSPRVTTSRDTKTDQSSPALPSE